MDDSQTLAISAIQHYAYCPRQFALIHLEQIWADNRFTAEGCCCIAESMVANQNSVEAFATNEPY